MSSIVAIKKDNIVYFGADTQTTTDVFKSNNVIEDRFKIKKMANGVLIGIVGTVYPSMVLRLNDDLFTQEAHVILTKEYIIKHYVNVLFKELEKSNQLTEDEKMTKSFDFRFIIAKEDKLFMVATSGAVFEIPNYIAIGSGEEYVYSYLYQRPLNNPQELIRSIMKLVSTYDSSVSAPFVYIDTEKLTYTIEEK
jgi:ATP-dependent protease HslVU (ClpYQ) peptidase subunit